MPRSYSFDHFQSINAEQVTGVRAAEKQGVTQQEDLPESATKIHYGKKHAQTEELFHAHQMEKQLEELAGVDRMPPKRAETQARTEAPQAEPQREPQINRGTPIGALPEPQEPPQQGFFREIYDDAGRHLRVVRMAAKDISRASWRLLTLPVEAAKLAARRFRPT